MPQYSYSVAFLLDFWCLLTLKPKTREGLGFGVWGLGLRIPGLECTADIASRVQGVVFSQG